jgi:hypothetical protein
MSDIYNTNDSLITDDFVKQPLPSTLNVLTILTFIGCALGLIFSMATPWMLNFALKMMDKASAGSTELTPKQVADMEVSRHAIQLSQNNLVPLIIIGLIGITLCFVGALMMRKLKKDGFWLYVGGQLLPLIGNLILLGTSQFTGATSYVMFLIPIIFIVLYYRQMKYLIK